MFIQDIFIAGKITFFNSLLLTDLKNVWKKVLKNYIFVDKIYIEILKFGDFSFGESLKIAKVGQKILRESLKCISKILYDCFRFALDENWSVSDITQVN